jgi:hypothetical protein
MDICIPMVNIIPDHIHMDIHITLHDITHITDHITMEDFIFPTPEVVLRVDKWRVQAALETERSLSARYEKARRGELVRQRVCRG